MAKSVLELAVGTGQWDAGLRKAKSALDNFTQSQGGLQQALEKDSENIRKFVQMMGKTESTAKTAKGQMNDYKSTIEQLTMQYNRMTEAQKNVIGQDYLQAIEQMKQKYHAVSEEIQEMNRSLNNAKMPDMKDGVGGLFGGGKLDGMLQVFGGNLMTKGAGMLAGLASEMADMVKQGIELAKQGEGIRIAFERLNRPDILDGLREATHGTVTDIELMKAAVKFNDFKLPLDELGTMLAFAQQKAKDTGQSVDYMVDSIVTGLGRKSLMILDNLGLSATEVKDKMAETGDMTKAVGAIIRDQMAKAGDYVETAADRAAQANVSLQNKMEELGRKFAPLQEASDNMWTSMKIGIMDVIGGPLTDLLNKLTEAGRLASAYGVLGGNAKVGRMTANLSSARDGNRQSIYQQQQQQFWKYINPREQQIRDIRAWQSGQRGEALQGRISAITEKYGSLDVTKIQAEVDAAKKMLADYQQAAKQILQPIKQEITPAITTSGGTTGGRGGGKGGKTITEEKDDFVEINGLINMASERVSDLQKRIREAPSESMITELRDQLKDAQAELDRLNGKWQDGLQATFKFDDSDVLEKVRDIEGVTIDPKTLTVTANTADAYNQVQQLLESVDGKTVTFTVQPKMETGTSIQNDAGISDYIASIKQQLETADYGTSLYSGLSAQLADMTALQNLVGASLKAGLGTAMFDAADATGKDFWTRAMEGSVEDTDWQAIVEKINEALKAAGLDTISLNFKTGDVKKQSKEMSKDWDKAASAIQSVGSAMSQIEDPAAKVVGTVAQAVATIALGYAQATTSAAKLGPWAWIAFAATGLATMISTISAIHSSTGYANGGVIKGNSYSGDNIGGMVNGGAGGFVGLNAGEVVLNAAQQSNLAQNLSGNLRSIHVVGKISGTDIILSADRTLMTQGKQLAVWGR